jgi:hypothetical protein
MPSPLHFAALRLRGEVVQMQNVQIAIHDRIYAEALRDLLMADGEHLVYLVDYPSPAIEGVVVIGEAVMTRPALSAGLDVGRCIVFTRKVAIEVNRLWEAGVRQVIHADYPPEVGRLVVLAAERRLNCGGAIQPESLLFDETDRLFLQRLRISD